MNYKFPLATSSWDADEYQAIDEVVKSGMFTMGSRVRKFEERFADYVGSKFSVMVNSGSSANLLMIAALFCSKNSDIKLNRGDEVIVPAVSWSTTFTPLQQYGMKVKFVDIDPDTLNFDLDAMAEAVTEKTRLIFAVNLLGNPNDFSAISSIIGDRNILLIEDNCESLGAKIGSKHAGTFGLMGSYSTFFSHHISTMEGGVIVTESEELYHILLSLRAHGWTRNLPDQNLVTGKKNDDQFHESFKFVLPGYNVRPLELSGSIGLKQLEKLPELIAGRCRNADMFKAVMENHPQLAIQQETGQSSWFGFSLVLRKGTTLSRSAVISKLNGLGFECRPIVAGNFTRNDVMSFFDAEIFGNLKNADHINENGFFIGNHHHNMEEAMDTLSKLKL